MPAPVPKRSTPSGAVDPEGADADGQLAGAAVGVDPADAAAVRAAGRASPASSMIRRALDLGAPVTEPGGKAAPSSSGQPAPARSSPRTVDTRWTSPGCFSTAHRSGTVTVPVAQTRPRSLRTRSTIITFSA